MKPLGYPVASQLRKSTIKYLQLNWTQTNERPHHHDRNQGIINQHANENIRRPLDQIQASHFKNDD